MFTGWNLQRVEGFHKVFHSGAELGLRDAHACMGALHIPALVSARTAGSRTDLIDQVPLEFRNIGCRKSAVDSVVGGDVCHELIDRRSDRRLASQSFVQGQPARRIGNDLAGRNSASSGRRGWTVRLIDLYDPVPQHPVGLAYKTNRYQNLAAREFGVLCRMVMDEMVTGRVPSGVDRGLLKSGVKRQRAS